MQTVKELPKVSRVAHRLKWEPILSKVKKGEWLGMTIEEFRALTGSKILVKEGISNTSYPIKNELIKYCTRTLPDGKVMLYFTKLSDNDDKR